MSRRGQISIDRIVAARSAVLPFYVIIRPDGSVTAADEVSEDGNDFLTTRMFGDQIAFRSIHGDYLSAEGDQVTSRRYCSSNERFTVEKLGAQYAFRARSGKYLSMSDRAPFVLLAATAGETELFQLFSLLMGGINVGKQLEVLERSGSVMLDGLLDEERLSALKAAIAERGGADAVSGSHETRVSGLAGLAPGFAELATDPLIMQLVRRSVSPAVKLSSMESCRTDADFVRKELETTTWHVVHPYSGAEYPGVADPRLTLTVTWFLDQLVPENCTWAWAKAPMSDGAYLPQLPHLASPEEVEAVAGTAQPLRASQGSVWLCLGPAWMSNDVGAASFWKDFDAQTRYKHLSGQKEQSFRALTDAQRSAPPREELCPMLVQAVYVRELVVLREQPPTTEALDNLGEAGRRLKRLC